MVAQVCGWGRELAVKGQEKAFWGVGNVLCLVGGGGYMTIYFDKNH